jgi:hypothetical protein
MNPGLLLCAKSTTGWYLINQLTLFEELQKGARSLSCFNDMSERDLGLAPSQYTKRWFNFSIPPARDGGLFHAMGKPDVALPSSSCHATTGRTSPCMTPLPMDSKNSQEENAAAAA